MTDYQIWLNGDYVLRSEAKIGMTDRGFRLGDVLFDTSRTYDGKVFRLREHLQRLYRSLKYVRIDPAMSIDDMERITLETVEANEELRRQENDDYMITQIVTRGEGGSVVNPSSPNVSIWIDPIAFDRYSPLYQEGAHAEVTKTRSYSSEQIDPKVKHYSRLNFVLADMEAADVDPNAFPLLLDMDGNLTESTGANFFIVTDGVLRTPGDSSILQGVSRMTVIDLAEQLNIPVAEEDLQPYDLYTADEVFLTSTSLCACPVSSINGKIVGNGDQPGPVTKAITDAYIDLVDYDFVAQYLKKLEV